jgi:hypothetical protein
MRAEVFTAVDMNTTIYYDIMPCGLVEGSNRSEESAAQFSGHSAKLHI